MKPEYWKEIATNCHYKVFAKKGETWETLEACPDQICVWSYGYEWITTNARPCTEAAFMKRFNQTRKKIEKAVVK